MVRGLVIVSAHAPLRAIAHNEGVACVYRVGRSTTGGDLDLACGV